MKAFDTVNRQKLWNALEEMGVPKHLIYVIRNIYVDTKIKIKINDTVSSESREINQGVKQGCPMSPTLINIYINVITKIGKMN